MGADGGHRQRGVPAGGGPASTELRPGGEGAQEYESGIIIVVTV
jgi:hypothetical protein